ncbi:MAG: GxxExxY protein, partial [Ignavibacteriae bacterium]|nr:GxxExxY protein [Ignavibacteriota bacterium]
MDKFDPLPKRVEELASITVDSAFKVHSTLGPGLLESVYEICLVHELKHRGMRVERQVAVPFVYDTVRF